MKIENLVEKSLKYHLEPTPGKIATLLTKSCKDALDLSLAYTPGVAYPTIEIDRNPENVFKYTNKGNLVAVISNGTAILGLGNLGALASKPVMEGKGVLFKRFADIDVFDIEINSNDPDKIIETVKLLEPTFGGINLEDIKAPECFYIEEKLIEIMDIPVFHDDQHGTAIISGAGLINALEIVNKKIDQIKVVFNGAGAAGIACAKHFLALGVKKENILMCDSNGVIYEGRKENMNKYKEFFAQKTNKRTLEDALKDADVFVGVSVKNCLTPQMLKSMAKNPIVFAMANPDPEITYELAIETRKDTIMATGRSDYPNQINNVLGFPFIFRGALDVKARKITEKMKIAATYALANIAKEPIIEPVKRAYQNQNFSFGPNYIVPKPFDPRIIEWEAFAVAKAACDENVAREPIKDWDNYKKSLKNRIKKYWEIDY
jgi:malate dehydrogenase (oxaloacetate-decarboxylating)(NADP+)